jgi:hypothetical protein
MYCMKTCRVFKGTLYLWVRDHVSKPKGNSKYLNAPESFRNLHSLRQLIDTADATTLMHVSTVIRRPLTAEGRVQSKATSCEIQSKATSCEIWGGQSGNGTKYFRSSSVLICQYHSTCVSQSFSYLSPAQYSLALTLILDMSVIGK